MIFHQKENNCMQIICQSSADPQKGEKNMILRRIFIFFVVSYFLFPQILESIYCFAVRKLDLNFGAVRTMTFLPLERFTWHSSDGWSDSVLLHMRSLNSNKHHSIGLTRFFVFYAFMDSFLSPINCSFGRTLKVS